jgi:glycosyltransferase involved in cell wall biosynthesis
VEFHFVGLPKWMTPFLRFMGGLHIYAYLWQWAAYFAARRLHRHIRFDLTHHLTYTNDWMASIIGARLSVPFVRGPGGGAHRIPKAFVKQFSLRARLSEQMRSFGQWLFRHDPFFYLGQRRASAILACNYEALESIPRRWREKVRLLSVNGISGEELAAPDSAPLPHARFQVLSAGRLVPLKGFDLALRAFRIFAEKHSDAELTIVGNGPELMRLQNLIHELGLEGNARIEEWMPRERLLDAMRSCDVFLFPSLRDGGGLVVVEAMAAGKPVICFDLGGPGLHINETCGFKISAITPEQSVGEMASALARLADDADLRFRMGRNAWQRAADVYDWDRVSECIMKVYAQVLGIKVLDSTRVVSRESISA